MSQFSVIPARAMCDPRVSNAAYRVLGVLASYADREGWCWPSQQTMADALGVKRQAVAKQLGALEELGYIDSRRRTRPDKGETSKAYRVLYDAEPASEQEDDARPDVAPPATSEVAPPATSRVAGPATSEVARTSHLTPQENDPSVSTRDRLRLLRPDAEPEPPPGRLTSEQELVLQHLHDRATRDVFAGGSPQWGYCRDLAVRGMTRSDVDAGIEAGLAKRMDHPAMRSSGVMNYAKAVIERRVEEREAGHDPDRRDVRGPAGRGAEAASGGSRARSHRPARVASGSAGRSASDERRWVLPEGPQHRAAE